ncbi:MAG TPA: tRNA uracil 4-sulfurtransferase ThiI [Longimicrobiales bacterium]
MRTPTPDEPRDAPTAAHAATPGGSREAPADAAPDASAPRLAPGERLLIVRLAGEFTIKSRRTQQTLRRALVRNLRDALDSTGDAYTLDAQFRHIVVRTRSARAAEVLTRVFGVSGVSIVEAVVAPTLEEIVRVGAERFHDRVVGRKFAVRARVRGDRRLSSRDIMVELGAALNPGATVDLDEPDVTVHVEVREDEAWLFADQRQGAGGLPLGVEGNAIALLSGGFDSPVAAWLILKRGVALDYVFCNLGGAAYERLVVQVAKVLADDWSYGRRPRLHVVDFGPVVDHMRERVKERYWQVVLKRLMYRAASAIGPQRDAQAIVTGEAIGQVSSQTLHNLRAIEPAASLPVFRPLLGFDKDEIIARARTIGTAALSEKVKEYCAITPGKPVTAATPEAVDAEEAKLDPAVLERAIAGRKVLDLRTLTAADLHEPYIFTDEIPPDAVVIDCRPEPQYEAWHFPGAIHRDEYDLLRDAKKLDRDQTYVLVCAAGVRTAHVAEMLQREGYDAYSFRGGVRALMRYAEEQGPAERDGS